MMARGLVENNLKSAEGRYGWCRQGKEGCERSRVGVVDDKSVGRVQQSSGLGVNFPARKQQAVECAGIWPRRLEEVAARTLAVSAVQIKHVRGAVPR